MGMSFTIKKNWRSRNFNFIGKKIWRNALPLKSKKVQGIFLETFILALSSLAVFRLQNRVSDSFYQSSLGTEVDFIDIMNVSPNILAKN